MKQDEAWKISPGQIEKLHIDFCKKLIINTWVYWKDEDLKKNEEIDNKQVS